MEYPTGFSHLLEILYKTDEKKMLSLSNPDGYFYLFYIKTCIKLFASIIFLSSSWLCYICYSSASIKYPTRSFVRQISLPLALLHENTYIAALIFTFISSMIAYYFLFNFCQEMSQFEFQPDQQVMDQFIQLHTVMIKGINKNISPESAERGIGKVFSLRFGHKQILKIQIFRNIGNINKLIKSRKIQKKLLNKAKKYNHRH